MDIATSLYDGMLIRLGPIDYEKDPAIESKWTHDAEYMRLLDPKPAYPLSAAQIKKRYENLEKEIEESKNLFHFAIRLRSDDAEQNDRLVGFARISWIEWTHGNGFINLGIGDPNDRRKGYGGEVLRLLLQYAFSELNLYRLTAAVPEYNVGASRLFANAGFVEEVRRRQALNRDGRRWDMIIMGLLQKEWQSIQPAS